MQDVETVKDFCPKDCFYRMRVGYNTPMCGYILIEGRSRGCDISKCDKYRKGRKRRYYEGIKDVKYALRGDED